MVMICCKAQPAYFNLAGAKQEFSPDLGGLQEGLCQIDAVSCGVGCLRSQQASAGLCDPEPCQTGFQYCPLPASTGISLTTVCCPCRAAMRPGTPDS